MLEQLKTESDILNQVITGDENWFFKYNLETKRGWGMAHVTISKTEKARMSKSEIKTMVIIFFNSRRVVHKEYIPPCATVNQKFYLEVLDHLRKRVMQVQMEIAMTGSFELYYNTLSVCIFMATMHLQASYYPDLSLSLLLLPKIKIKYQGLSFSNTSQCSEGCTWRHQDSNRSCLPILLWGVKNSLDQVCCIRGTLFWRG